MALRRFHLLLFLLGFASTCARATAEERESKEKPSRIQPHVFVLSAGWTAQIPPTGKVNYPEHHTTLYPGQNIALGILASGPQHETLLKDVTIRARFTPGANGEERGELKPIALRQIKAQGADFALMALKAAGISEPDRAETERVTAQSTLAVFLPGWSAPRSEEPVEVEISIDVMGATEPVTIPPAQLKVRPDHEWLSEPRSSPETMAKSMNRYREDPPPGQLIAHFAAFANDPAFKAPPIHGFFAFAFKWNGAAREAAIRLYPKLEPKTQAALLWVLRLGGHNLAELFPDLPKKTLAEFDPVQPLADPRELPRFQDPIDRKAVSDIGHAMDCCWAAWTATGDQSYLRALVGLLEGAPDYPAFKTWQETRGGAKGLNARVARGLAYQIAGWSIGSFQRTDPHVADWLAYWTTDLGVSALVRQEIAGLPTNSAFRRK